MEETISVFSEFVGKESGAIVHWREQEVAIDQFTMIVISDFGSSSLVPPSNLSVLNSIPIDCFFC